MDIPGIVISATATVFAGLSGIVGTLYAHLREEHKRVLARNETLETKLDELTQAELERAIKERDAEKAEGLAEAEKVKHWATLIAAFERLQERGYGGRR